jgi:hypothetical protein
MTTTSNSATWATDELRKIASTDDLHISPLRADGVTLGTPTWIWSVVVDHDLYVRAYHGHDSSWYKAAVQQKAGRITAAGLTKDVSFETVDDEAHKTLSDHIDDAYRSKYSTSPYLKPMIAARARHATVRIVPQNAPRKAK